VNSGGGGGGSDRRNPTLMAARILPQEASMPRRKRGPTLIQRSRRVAPGQKAIYHQITGAGRTRVFRKFFELNEADMDAIAAEMERQLGERLKGDA
jgi:hypothetical protein